MRKGATSDGTIFSNNSPTYPGLLPITPLQVASRNQHGNARFNLNLPNVLAPSIECRLAGPNAGYTLVYTFDRPVTGADNATLTQGVGNQPTIRPGPNPKQLTVNLTGVSNVQHLVVSLNGVHDTLGQTLATISSRMDVLVADTNGDGSYMMCGLSRGAQITAKVGIAGKSTLEEKLVVPASMVLEHDFQFGAR